MYSSARPCSTIKEGDITWAGPNCYRNRNPLGSPPSEPLNPNRPATSSRWTCARLSSFADYFIICTGGNSRQIQAIADEIEPQLKERGEYPFSIEGYQNAEWVLVDYGDLVIHIFSEKARKYYDLERLWRDAKH